MVKKIEDNKKNCKFRGRESQRIEDGEEGSEIQDQGLAQATTGEYMNDSTPSSTPRLARSGGTSEGWRSDSIWLPV